MLCVQWVIGHLFLFLLSKISISTLEKYYFFISLSTLEARDQNFKFLFLNRKIARIMTRQTHFGDTPDLSLTRQT